MLRSEILGLYKSLIRYSETLRFTDKKYFVHRVRRSFLENKELTDKDKIEFQYKHCGTQLLYAFTNRAVFASAQQSYYSMKSRIDTSKVPKINEDDLEIQYVRGSGPGGQATNKTSNNVVMKHLPTGLVIKCHETRSQSQNLKIAKEKLINKLDLLYNGEDAVENQKKKLLAKKTSEKQRRQKKRAALKASFKESLENGEDAKKDE
ncbi:hypothetical protein TSAR_009629 [Trichomalopsis sarcophagae]|uniref:Uncharacterized protein n=1 Tax=Trichomalopsis sarcophagae TaxID=543379 RepID=A0A232F0S9_9HYME|nr:hypothetical protein TSAR_009629 [Trichomalopsis sarcophagae]